MKITFNGTAASEGFPALFCECSFCTEARKLGGKNLRRRTSVTIDDKILIDLNPDTYCANLYGKLDLREITHVIFSHSHSDHCYPEDLRGIISPCAETDRKEPLYVYGNKTVYEKCIENEFLDYERDGFAKFQMMELNKSFYIDDYKITPLEGNHSDESEDSMLLIVERKGKTFFYGLDSGEYTENFWENVKKFKIDTAVLDCSTIEAPSIFKTHSGIPENLKMIEIMEKNNVVDENTKIYLSHFIHNYNPLYKNLEKVCKKYGFYQAYDDLEIEV